MIPKDLQPGDTLLRNDTVCSSRDGHVFFERLFYGHYQIMCKWCGVTGIEITKKIKQV